MSTLLLYLVGIIHFVLMSQCFYSILVNVFPNSDQWAKADEITYSNMSFQYVAMMMFLLCAILFSFRDLSKILMINDKGIYMVLSFCLYLIYLGVKSLFTENINFPLTGTPGQNNGEDLILFTGDVNTLIGIFANAFSVHSVLFGIMKNNKNQSKNTRDLGLAYCLVFGFYMVMGVFGMFAVAALYNRSGYDKIPGSITELLVKSNSYLSTAEYSIGCVAIFLIFTQLTTVIPVICFFSRRQFFELIYGPKVRISNFNFHAFNAFYNISCLIVALIGWDISKIIGFTGAVAGFLLIYIIPISVHLKCMYSSPKETVKPSLSAEDTEEGFQNALTPNKQALQEKCREHGPGMENSFLAFGFYGLLILIGSGILVGQLIDLF